MMVSSGSAERESSTPWHHQQFERVDSGRGQRIDSSLSCMEPSSAAYALPERRDDNGSQQHSQFPQHPDGDQVDHIDVRAEPAQLPRAHVGDDQR